MTTLAPPDLPDAEARVRRLRAPLLSELRDAPRRRRLVPVVVAAALAAVAVPVALVSHDTEPALAVEREDGWLVLRIADVTAGEEALTRELRDAGIRGEVRLLPVPPDDVGTWAVISERAGRSDGGKETVRLDRVRYERETLRVPVAELRESTGYFVFYAGRETQPGEEPWRDGDTRFRP